VGGCYIAFVKICIDNYSSGKSKPIVKALEELEAMAAELQPDD
jgi:hypothetical protein